MPTLTINNETTITNVAGVSLTAIPVVNPRIGVVVVAGAKGDRGDAGTGQGIAQSVLDATGALLNYTIEQTGRILYEDIIGLSGMIGAGGVTQSQLDATGAKITSLSGYVDDNFYLKTNPSGYITGFSSGDYATNAALALTGEQAWNAGQNNATNLSGAIFDTGAFSIAYANSIAQSLSGSLSATGRRAWDDAINLSGRLVASGLILDIYIDAVSGNLTLTGQIAQNNALNLSGNLNASGRRAWDDAINLSGRLFASGSILDAYIDAVSGNLGLTGQTAHNNALNLSGNLNASGRRAWDDAINLSGRIFATGALLAIVSGGLEARISASSASDIAYANSVGTNLSGNLTLTGQALQTAIASTGNQAWNHSQNNALNLSGRLTATGALLSAVKVTGSSTIQNPNFSGLGGTLILQSGNFILISGAAGSAAVANNGDGINLSGNLTSTGAYLYQRDLDISGYIIGLINSSAAGVSTINGLSGTVAIVGTGSLISITNLGQAIYVSGNNNDGINLSGNLFGTGAQIGLVSGALDIKIRATGQAGINYTDARVAASGQQNYNLTIGGDTNISGNLATISSNLISTGQSNWLYTSGVSGNLTLTGQSLLASIASTGGQAWSASQNNALNLSGNLNATGRRAWDDAINLSGRLVASGLVLDTYIDAVSGNLGLTGQIAQNNALNLSGNLNASGRRAWDDAVNLSGNLFTTGSTLIARDLTTSGELSNRLAQTGLNLSAVRATGSSIMQNPNFTGMGTTLVIRSGDFILISGAGAGGGGEVNTASNLGAGVGTGLFAQKSSLDLQFYGVQGTGNISLIMAGNVVYFSGSSAPGVVDHGDGLNLSGNLNSSGRRAWDDATNLSGRLVASGLVIDTYVDAVSGNLILTGQIAQNNALNLSGNLNATGRRAWDDAINLSGNINASGRNLWNNDINLSGNLSSTGYVNWIYTSGTSGNLTLSGQALLTAIASTGQAGVNYTDARVAATGLASVNYADIRVAATGLAAVNYTDARVVATGQAAWTASQNNAINLSGNINSSGRRAWDDSINLSGRLFATGAALSALSVTGSTIIQSPILTGLGGSLVIQSGNFILFSGAGGGAAAPANNGDGINLSGNLNASGRRAWDDAINLSGRLVASGFILDTYVDAVSGNLGLTGQTAQNNVLNLSGSLFATGAAAISHANSIGVNLSGNVNASGRRAWDDATNLSGRLFTTGANLSAISVTGGFMQTPNFSGMGTTLVIRSGNFVLISGAGAGAGGGEVNTASNLGVGVGVYNQKVVADLQFNSLVGGTGLSVFQSGQNIIINNPIKSSITMGMRESSIISVGEKGRVIIGNSGFIVGWDLISKETSNLTLEVWKSNKQNPIGANNICPLLAPKLEAMQYSGSSNLAGWTTSVGDGDIMSLSVTQNSASTDFTLRLDVIYIQ